ncbi:MAG TPA: type III pantothenate kinase [Planctomycetota bacterium]|nr:type III pantothenate kinase [Planctomycetota bacterium]
MLLALDLGNSALTVGLHDGRRFLLRFSVPVVDFSVLVHRFEEKLARYLDAVDHVALASVNPSWVYAIEGSIVTLWPHVKLTRVGIDVQVPIEARVKRREEVGVDRLLNALAAWRHLGEACLVADFGSALTLDVVSTDGAYLGGVITPGIGMSAQALHRQTALLPEVKPEPVDHVIGTDTITCIQSGLFWGTVSELEGLVARLRKEYPPARKVLATGGYAELIAREARVIDEVLPELTLEGIRLTLEDKK